jgi:uncharacterized protein YcnI
MKIKNTIPLHGRTGALRVVGALTATAAAVLVLPAVASAHVTVQPGTAEGGGFTVVAFRVPNERDDANTTRVRVTLPKDQPIGSVRTTPVPGWKVVTTTRHLDQPIEMFGEQVSDVIAQVTWTATGEGIAPGQFEDFELNLGPLPDSGDLVFPARQTYSSGEQVDWNEVAVDDSAEPEHPAPVLTVSQPADGAPSPTSSADPSGSAGGEDEAGSVEDDGGSETLPLVLSSVAVLVSLGALALAWTRRRA